MHLTNYSINKHSEGFDHSQSVDKGSKRYVGGLLHAVKGRGTATGHRLITVPASLFIQSFCVSNRHGSACLRVYTYSEKVQKQEETQTITTILFLIHSILVYHI